MSTSLAPVKRWAPTPGRVQEATATGLEVRARRRLSRPLAELRLYAPLAIVIIGGLISSTLLARIVTPVMYQLLAPRVEPVAQEV